MVASRDLRVHKEIYNEDKLAENGDAMLYVSTPQYKEESR